MSVIGNKAPSFAGKAALHGEIKDVSLDDYKGKWLVLFFYPLDFTFVCPTEIVAFDDAAAQFREAGAEIVGVSVDSVHTHLAWTRTPRSEAGVGELSYPLLSDLGGRIAAAYDVLNGDVALRGVFVIDPEGTVQSATINFLPIGRNVAEVFRTLKAAQYVASSGNVCQANWEDGDEGMAATLEGVKGKIG
ncbi:MAG: peroxiredoxin [Alphaproteobacteria bacterium]|nr:peroxiredoxin [Alphaproteobacteria bacterium]